MTFSPGQLVVTPRGTGTVKWVFEAHHKRAAQRSTVSVELPGQCTAQVFWWKEVQVVQ